MRLRAGAREIFAHSATSLRLRAAATIKRAEKKKAEASAIGLNMNCLTEEE